MNPVLFACIVVLGVALVAMCILKFLDWLDGG